jgi:hypothetical protein
VLREQKWPRDQEPRQSSDHTNVDSKTSLVADSVPPVLNMGGPAASCKLQAGSGAALRQSVVLRIAVVTEPGLLVIRTGQIVEADVNFCQLSLRPRTEVRSQHDCL